MKTRIIALFLVSSCLLINLSCEPDCEGDECEPQIEGQPGNPRFNLQFTNHENVDLDLYVEDPLGNIIYYGNPWTDTGGSLDLDCLCGDCPDGPNENIFWPIDGSAPAGTYKYWVNYYSDCGNFGAISNFTVRVLQNNTIVETKSGSLSSGSSATWTYTHR